ncbi:Tyrosinase ustQ [Lachnellula arida]|uniref:Tyrosinase ustQ n=1 Tax=Lachnellula arida TaxID=1316785 RepID=A0A8T9B8M5_9HELO|nr:Tyrosinase ustQ [Lachnellula arida]
MAKSPVWDTETGFGGNGNENAGRSVGKGHCVTDGPFANLTVQYFSVKREPHCLSRGFLHGEILDHRFGDRVRPQLIESLLEEPDYDAFNSRLEAGPHDAVPRGVNGDFSRATAPNALDRMWWKWQQRDPRQRSLAYGGNLTKYSLDDVFHFGGFALDRKVSELMSTESELLCYTY